MPLAWRRFICRQRLNRIYSLGCRDQSWDVKAAVSCIQDSVAFLRRYHGLRELLEKSQSRVEKAELKNIPRFTNSSCVLISITNRK